MIAQISLFVAWLAWAALMLACLIWLAWCLAQPEDDQ